MLRAARRYLMPRDRAAAEISRSPDRRLLLGQILPYLAAEGGACLFVGTQRYTETYPALLERGGGTCWTIDREPEAGCFGAPDRHVTADIRSASTVLPQDYFDAIICNGVFGYGLNSQKDQQDGVDAMSGLLRAGGRLVLGWNAFRTSNRRIAELTSGNFVDRQLGHLPTRLAVAGSDHRYGFFAKRVER